MKVDLVLRPESIVMTAIGGTGMGPTELERDYLRWGASRKRAGDRIGRYGQGGKAAIGHLGNRFVVTASRAGDDRAITFEDPAYRDRAKLRVYELLDRAKPVEPELGYVRIEIGSVRWIAGWTRVGFLAALPRSIGPCSKPATWRSP